MDWWQDFFGTEYVRAWEAAGAFADTDDLVDGIAGMLEGAPGTRVLDVPCGFGRVAGALHGRGYEVTGVDASSAQIALAREHHPGPAYVEGDMREPPPGPYDAVLNIFSSFGYFAGAAQDAQALRAWHEVLAPAGLLVMDLNHRDHVARHFQPLRGTVVVEHSTVDWVTGIVQSTVTHGAWSGTFRVRLYTVTELVRMLADAGFVNIEAAGGFAGQPVTPDTRLVLRAERGAG